MSGSVFGIDRISLSYWALDVAQPLSKASAAPWDREQLLRASDGHMRSVFAKSVDVGGARVFVRARETSRSRKVSLEDGGLDLDQWEMAPYSVWLDWNPSRQRHGDSGDLIDVEDLESAIVDVLVVLQDNNLVTVADSVTAGRVTRLDLTRDFTGNGEAAARVLEHLSRTAHRTFRNKAMADVESVYWNGPKQCAVKAYNKGRERGLDRNDWLRTEVVAGKEWLRKAGLTTVGMISAAAIEALGTLHWLASGLGETMITTDKELVRALMHKGYSDKQVMSFLGWCFCRDMPGGPVVSSATLAKYRRLEKALGGVNLRQSEQHSARLDLDNGTIIEERLAS